MSARAWKGAQQWLCYMLAVTGTEMLLTKQKRHNFLSVAEMAIKRITVHTRRHNFTLAAGRKCPQSLLPCPSLRRDVNVTMGHDPHIRPYGLGTWSSYLPVLTGRNPEYVSKE